MLGGYLCKQALFLAHDGLLLHFPDTILFMIPTPIREGNIATPPKINPCRLLKLFRFRMSGEFVGDMHTLYCFLLAHCEPGSQSESVRRSSPVRIYATGDWEVRTNQGMSAVNSSWHTLDRASTVPGCLENCTLGEPQWHLEAIRKPLHTVAAGSCSILAVMKRRAIAGTEPV